MSNSKDKHVPSGDDIRKHVSKVVDFAVLARGLASKKTGVLVAYIPAGSRLDSPESLRAEEEHLRGFAAATQVRPRADVCVVRTVETGTGKVRFFTPRPQQVEWPSS